MPKLTEQERDALFDAAVLRAEQIEATPRRPHQDVMPTGGTEEQRKRREQNRRYAERKSAGLVGTVTNSVATTADRYDNGRLKPTPAQRKRNMELQRLRHRSVSRPSAMVARPQEAMDHVVRAIDCLETSDEDGVRVHLQLVIRAMQGKP